ncbi:MAG TPA: NAD-binding oxidoreductase [Myxococcota bacterium]
MTEALVPVPVVDTKLAAARQVLLTLEAPHHTAAHLLPGQYARLAFEDGVPRPFAIASAPGSARFEFLLKVPEERVAPLLALGSGDKIQMGAPQGKGFPIDAAHGKALLLFAVGSGIAPIRAVIEHLLPRRGEIGEITLFYGVRDPSELCFTARFGTWAGHGVGVLPIVSRAAHGAGAWDGRRGRVQDHLPKELASPERVVAFVCGLPEMDRDVAGALLARGVGPEQVFRNW